MSTLKSLERLEIAHILSCLDPAIQNNVPMGSVYEHSDEPVLRSRTYMCHVAQDSTAAVDSHEFPGVLACCGRCVAVLHRQRRQEQ